MKKRIYLAVSVLAVVLLMQAGLLAQDAGNIIHVTSLKTKMVEGGSWQVRDSLIAIYNNNVIKKNDKILSHRELSHYFTASSTDYLVIDEYKDFASLEEAFKLNDELEKKAWPDEKQRKEFLKAMGAYFEQWHGDEIYHMNAKLSKN
jgi:hypothetical protein